MDKEKGIFHEAGQSLARLVQIAATLRGEHGCVWDREQTVLSLKPFLLEECYELLAAIDEESIKGKDEHKDEHNYEHNNVKEELGDLLYQIVFLSQIFSEEKKFTISDVINYICAKLIRRHPHVFGNEKVADSKEVLARWEEIKKEEGKFPKKSLLDGVPHQLPGLMRAHRLQEKAARVGFDWEYADQVLAKIREEIKEFEKAFFAQDAQAMEDELGDIFFSLVNMARFIQVDPEKALAGTIRRFISRFQFIERKAKEEGTNLRNMSIQEMDYLWEVAKKSEE